MEKPKHIEVMRELDERRTAGIQVWLGYYAGTETAHIKYLDEVTGEAFCYDVEPGFNEKTGKSNAYEAFLHPNVYRPEDGTAG